MDRLYKVYTASSILFLVILMLSPIKERFTLWRDLQGDYKQYSKTLQNTDQTRIEYQQIWVRDLNRIDRCPTCHLPIDTDDSDLPTPFRKHPNVFHDTEKFGCTICHDGQGLATTYEDAHLPSEHWDRPVLPKRYLEASCGRCHINQTLKETPILNRGRELVHDLKCVGCHELPDENEVFTFTLDGIGQKIKNREWLIGWLQNPTSFRSKTKMPNFFFSQEEAVRLANFIMSLREFAAIETLEPLPAIYGQQKDKTDFIQTGATLFREAPCISCHTVRNQGGILAVELADVASKATDAWMYNFIKNPKQLQPDIDMPQFNYSRDEFAAITAYMSADFIDWDASSNQQDADIESMERNTEVGKSIFYKYNCIGCHTSSSLKIEEFPGPELTTIGSKKTYKIYFGETNIPNTLYDFLETNLKTPRVFGETMRMPDNNLSTQDRHAITTYLLSLHEEEFPNQYIVEKSQPPIFNPKGEAGKIFTKYNCLKCHTIYDAGGKIAPDLSIVGSRLQRDWIKQFVKLPYSIRPTIEERMVKLSISNREIDLLLDYFNTVFLDDRVSTPMAFDYSTQSQTMGEKHFWQDYGCQSCHMIAGQGGVVGPSFDQINTRLQPTWMFHWLMNPQRYIPDTIEPRTGMTETEIKEVVSYLMSIK